MGTKATYKHPYTRGFLKYYDNVSLGEGGECLQVVCPITIYDDFTGVAVDATNDWVKSIVNSSTFAPVAGEHGGIARITTGAADDDDMEVSTSLCFKASAGIGMETRIATGDIANTAMNIGFTDAVTEAADLLAFTFATTVLTNTADDAALFFTDKDATTNLLRFAASKATTASAITTGTLPVDGAFHVYRVEIDSSGNIAAYYDGALFASVSAGITITDPLCAYIGLINREAFANTLDVDYIRVWSLSR